MPSTDLDLLDGASIMASIDSFTESVEAHVDSVARSLQDAFRETTWLPDAIKPRPPPPPPRLAKLCPPSGWFDASWKWVSEHRAIVVAAAAFT